MRGSYTSQNHCWFWQTYPLDMRIKWVSQNNEKMQRQRNIKISHRITVHEIFEYWSQISQLVTLWDILCDKDLYLFFLTENIYCIYAVTMFHQIHKYITGSGPCKMSPVPFPTKDLTIILIRVSISDQSKGQGFHRDTIFRITYI